MRVLCCCGILSGPLYGCFDFSDNAPIASCRLDTECPDGTCIDNRCVESAAACDPGFEAGPSADGACVDIDECMREGDAAPCSPLTECTNNPGSFTCTACPEGYEDDAQSGEACTPTLLGLNFSAFVSLDSEFAPSQRDYTVTFPSWLDRFEARFAIPEGVELRSENESIDDPNRVILESDSVAGFPVPFTVQIHGLSTTYNFTFEEHLSEPTLRASNLGDDDRFGEAVAVADGVIVVGAEREDGPDPNGMADAIGGSGAAYVFEQSADGTWEERALLRASNLGEGDNFGAAVAVADGVIVAGAPFENGPDAGGVADAISDSGAAYVFERNADDTWEERALLRASNLGDGDVFGGSVAIADGVIVVGAGGEDGPDAGGVADAIGGSGAAYVFERNANGTWEERALLRASNLGERDNFGAAVAFADGVIVAGAPFENGPDAGGVADAISDSGAAYVFERNADGTWEERALLHASNLGEGDVFGGSIAIADGVIVVGARSEDGLDPVTMADALENSGAAYVFERNADGTWEERALLRASNLGEGDVFGGSVAIAEGVIVVGARSEDGPDPNGMADAIGGSGAAYVFERNADGTWEERALLRALALGQSDQFGGSVAVTNGVIVVGASFEDAPVAGVANVVQDSGAAYVF